MNPFVLLLLVGGAFAVLAMRRRATATPPVAQPPPPGKPPPGPPAPPTPPPKPPTPAKRSYTVVAKNPDPVEARKLMGAVASNLSSQGSNYDPAMLRGFQKAAGLTPDGLYGGRTRGALLYYGAPIIIPKPMHGPNITYKYVLPGQNAGK